MVVEHLKPEIFVMDSFRETGENLMPDMYWSGLSI